MKKVALLPVIFTVLSLSSCSKERAYNKVTFLNTPNGDVVQYFPNGVYPHYDGTYSTTPSKDDRYSPQLEPVSGEATYTYKYKVSIVGSDFSFTKYFFKNTYPLFYEYGIYETDLTTHLITKDLTYYQVKFYNTPGSAIITKFFEKGATVSLSNYEYQRFSDTPIKATGPLDLSYRYKATFIGARNNYGEFVSEYTTYFNSGTSYIGYYGDGVTNYYFHGWPYNFNYWYDQYGYQYTYFGGIYINELKDYEFSANYSSSYW